MLDTLTVVRMKVEYPALDKFVTSVISLPPNPTTVLQFPKKRKSHPTRILPNKSKHFNEQVWMSGCWDFWMSGYCNCKEYQCEYCYILRL